MSEGKLMAVGTGGTRRISTTIPVTHQDRLHIGSDAKAMMSLLAAMMMESGKLQWDERVGEKSWEELIVERVFKPLKLTRTGLGPQATLDQTDAPLKRALVHGKLKPMLGGPEADNPLVTSPAGTAHMSVLDFARWGSWTAGQGKRAPFLDKPETMKKLVRPIVSTSLASTASTTVTGAAQYALGWASTKMAWTAYPVAFHGGSNMNKAYILVDTERDAAAVVMTNVATPNPDGVMQKFAGSYAGAT